MYHSNYKERFIAHRDTTHVVSYMPSEFAKPHQ